MHEFKIKYKMTSYVELFFEEITMTPSRDSIQQRIKNYCDISHNFIITIIIIIGKIIACLLRMVTRVAERRTMKNLTF